MSVTETTYTDGGLNPATTYYYQVSAMNAAGVSTNATATVVPAPLAPLSLSAVPGDSQVSLSWTSVPGATGYYIYSGPDSGDETNLVAGNIPSTSYINTGLTNGTTYFYIVTSTNSNGESPNSPEASATPYSGVAPATRSLIWNGDGVANVWDVDGAANWQTNAVDTVFNNGDSVTFNNSGSNNVAIPVAGTPQPAFTIFNATKAYTIAGPGSIAGTNTLIKTSTGTLTINNTNLFSGGTVISNGTVLPGNIPANTAAWGSGPIILAGGTLQFNGYGTRDSGTGWGGCTNTINVPAGKTGTLLLPARFGYASPFNSALTGGGTLNVTVEYVRDYFSGDWSAFTGRINVSAPASGAYYTTGDFRIDNPKGYANAAIFLSSVNMYNINANGQTTDIGELGGNSTAFIGAGGSSNPTWRVGARNTTNTYAGVIADAGVTSLTKIGTGMLILSGINNSYSGATTVSGGILNVINTNGTATGFGSVTIANGGTLAGNGIVAGPVTVNSGGALAPGNPLGTLRVTNNLTLSAGSSTYVQVQHSPLTNDSVTVLGTLAEGGTLNVTNSGAAALAVGDTFHLFNAGTYSGSFSSLVLPQLSGGLAWNTNALKTAGVLSVMALSSPTIATTTLSGGNLVLIGSGGINGWTYYLLTSTNLNLPVAQWARVATNQFDGSGNFSVTNAVNPAAPQTYYRIQLQ